MKRILVTGATGNVGREVISGLLSMAGNFSIIAGVRNVEKDSKAFPNGGIGFEHFDFENANSFHAAFSKCDILFLLRPPQLADVNKYFVPLIEAAKHHKIEHIVFLSVQGAERSAIIPHHKIERLIIQSQIAYSFMRPAYFMQNFTTTLHKDLVERRLIFLPAGSAKFTLIDTADVGMATAAVLVNPTKHQGKSYELTNDEQLTFREMAQKLSDGTGTQITYESPNLLRFFLQKRKEHTAIPFIFVMIMLHYFPRFQKVPQTTNCVQMLTGRQPGTFDEFVSENRALLC